MNTKNEKGGQTMNRLKYTNVQIGRWICYDLVGYDILCNSLDEKRGEAAEIWKEQFETLDDILRELQMDNVMRMLKKTNRLDDIGRFIDMIFCVPIILIDWMVALIAIKFDKTRKG